jgi:hypothetical protein
VPPVRLPGWKNKSWYNFAMGENLEDGQVLYGNGSSSKSNKIPNSSSEATGGKFKFRRPDITEEEKSPVLWGEGDAPKCIQSFRELLGNEELRKNAEIDLKIRHQDLYDEIRDSYGSENEAGFRDWEEKTIQLLMWYNAGSRLINELLIRVTDTESEDPNAFGNMARAALRDPSCADHADPHTRLIDAVQKMNVILCGAQVFDESGLFVMAAAMKPILHDFSQLLVQYRKAQHKKDPEWKKLDPKDAHKEEAAVIACVFKPFIQEIGHMSGDLADQLTTVLAADMAVHDRLEDFQQRLGDEEKVPAEGLEPQELYERSMNGTIDQYSLSTKDRLVIMRLVQQKSGEKRAFDPVIYGEYGLGAEFEERFRKEIEQAMSDARRFRSEELHADPVLRVGWASIFNLADIYEMIAPGKYAVVRKEQVHRSTIRPLAQPETDDEAVLTLNSPDAYNSSTWCRAMYEYLAFIRVIKKSPFYTNEIFKNFITNTILFHMLQAEELYEQLALGEEGLSGLDDIKGERIRNLAIKSLRKIDTAPEEVLDFAQQIGNKTASEVIDITRERVLSDPKGSEYGRLFLERASVINTQIETVKYNIRHKPHPDETKSDGVAYTFTDAERGKMKQNFSRIWIQACIELDIENDEASGIRSDMKSRSIQQILISYPMLMNVGYDSLGGLWLARTLNPLEIDIAARLRLNPSLRS